MLFAIGLYYFLTGSEVAYLTRGIGVVLLVLLAIYLAMLFADVKKNHKNLVKEEKTKFDFKDIIKIILGIIGVVGGRTTCS